MTDDLKPQSPPPGSSKNDVQAAVVTFAFVALLLAAVLGSVWYVGTGLQHQAKAGAADTSATGSGSGEAGRDAR